MVVVTSISSALRARKRAVTFKQAEVAVEPPSTTLPHSFLAGEGGVTWKMRPEAHTHLLIV
jgi:hypothetical protein